MIGILQHLIYISMYHLTRISSVLVYDVYIRSCRLSTISSLKEIYEHLLQPVCPESPIHGLIKEYTLNHITDPYLI